MCTNFLGDYANRKRPLNRFTSIWAFLGGWQRNRYSDTVTNYMRKSSRWLERCCGFEAMNSNKVYSTSQLIRMDIWQMLNTKWEAKERKRRGGEIGKIEKNNTGPASGSGPEWWTRLTVQFIKKTLSSYSVYFHRFSFISKCHLYFIFVVVWNFSFNALDIIISICHHSTHTLMINGLIIFVVVVF